MANFINREMYSFLYGNGNVAAVLKKRAKAQIAGSVSAVGLMPVSAAAGLGWGRGFLLFLLSLLCIWIVPELIAYEKAKELRLAIRMGIPAFLDVVSLLLEAGQPIWKAVYTGAETEKSELSTRILKALKSGGSMESGNSPEYKLEAFASDVKMPEITSIVATIVQNSRKGTKELSEILRIQSSIFRQQRVEIAEELGNRASNLMLLPTVLVFIGIIILLISPAVMQFNNII